MNNRLIFEDNSNKNQIKLYRNASLDSTSSSLRVKKIKLYKENTPLIKLSQNKKKILDFPICMSLFTNNQSLSEKDSKMKLNSSIKFNLNCPVINNNNNLKNNKQNELLIPKEKKIISRNISGKYLKSFSPFNSFIKKSILNISKFPVSTSRNILLKKINYSPLNRLSSHFNKDIKNLKKFQYNLKNYSISNSTLEQEISAIRSVKNTSIGNINYINQNEKNNYSIPYEIFSQRDNGAKIKKIMSFSNRVIKNITKMNEELFNEKFIHSSKNQFNLKDTLIKDKKLEDITKNETMKKENFDKKKKLNESKITKKKKNNQLLFKVDKDDKKKGRNKNNEVMKVFKRNPSKQKTLSMISKDNQEEEKNVQNNKIYPVNLMIEKEKLEKLKKNKYYLTVYNNKTNYIYGKNLFLKGINKMITEKTINNRINTKIFLRKTEMLINSKEIITRKFAKEKIKLKNYEDLFNIEKKTLDFKEKVNYRKRTQKYHDIILRMGSINKNIKAECSFNHSLNYYFFTKIEFGEIYLDGPTTITPRKKISANNNIGKLTEVNMSKRHYTVQVRKQNITNDLDDTFAKKKSTISCNKNFQYLQLSKNVNNLMLIHSYILKSLAFDNDEMMNKYSRNKNLGNGKANRMRYQLFHKKTSKLLGALGLNSSKVVITRKNTFNSIQNDNEVQYNKQVIKRGSMITFEGLKNTLKKQLSHKTYDSNHDNILSVLKYSNFFEKNKSKKEFLDSLDNTKKKKKIEERRESQINFEDLYFELVKLIIEGRNNAFQNFFQKNQNWIDINQELFDGNTLLILSAREGNYYITKFLCEQNADVNIQNFSGNTALHFAIGKQFYAIADILTRYGATEDIKNARGLAPWDCIGNDIE